MSDTNKEREIALLTKHYAMLKSAIADIVDYVNLYDVYGWDIETLVENINEAMERGRRDVDLLNPHGIEAQRKEIEAAPEPP